MKRILIAASAGFCFGVKRAISIANETAGKAAARGASGQDAIPSILWVR